MKLTDKSLAIYREWLDNEPGDGVPNSVWEWRIIARQLLGKVDELEAKIEQFKLEDSRAQA